VAGAAMGLALIISGVLGLLIGARISA
jgi:hypothetical protein